MAHENELLRAFFEDIFNRRKGRSDTIVIRNGQCFILRHVEISAHKDRFALEIDIFYG